MRVEMRLRFVILLLVAVGVGCGGHGALPPTHIVGESPPHTPQSTQIPQLMKRYVIGFAKGRREPVFSKVLYGPALQRVALIALLHENGGQANTAVSSSPRGVLSLPAPTPSPWCPASANGSANTWACGWLTPPSGYVALDVYCTDCTSPQDDPLTTVVTYDPSFTPPPNLVTETYGCDNLTCASSPDICTAGSECQSQSCSQYPSCYTETKVIANEGTPPANVHIVLQSSSLSTTFTPLDMYASVTPDVLDLNIIAADQVVSWPHPTPSSIVAGQEVRLKASPAANLTSTNWAFDPADPMDVVGSYGLLGPTPGPSPFGPPFIALPSPAPSSGNPIQVYFGRPKTHHFYMNATATGVQGPLIVDIYYPVTGVSSPKGTGDNGLANVDVGVDNVSTNPNNCSTVVVITALHLGIPCKTKAIPKPTPGVNLFTIAQAPSASGVLLGVAQVMYLSFNGVKKTDGTPVSWQSDPYSNLQLDTQFPMSGFTLSVPAGGTGNATWPDSPFYNLGASACSYVSEAYTFQTYFMYNANARTSGHPSIWVPYVDITWNWSGGAQELTASPTPSWTLAPSPSPLSASAAGPYPAPFPTWSTIPVVSLPC